MQVSREVLSASHLTIEMLGFHPGFSDWGSKQFLMLAGQVYNPEPSLQPGVPFVVVGSC